MTNTFEKFYHTDPSRERAFEIERPSIELSPKEHLERVRASKELQDAGFIYKPPVESELPPELKEKFELAKKLTKDTKVIELKEKDKRKSPKRKAKKAKGSV